MNSIQERIVTKSRSFTIFLLKEGYNNTNALVEDHGLEQITNASSIPSGASLFVGDNLPNPPWWKSYFGINKTLNQSLKSAILFVPNSNRYFALSFGHAYSKLDDLAYEYDFGLRVTLNCIEPNELNSTDTVEPINGRRKRTQIPNASDLTLFDFDKDISILRNITGKVKPEHEKFFKKPSGANSLRISSSITADEIPTLLTELFIAYNQKTYKEAFPNLLNITPIKDPKILNKLNEKLVTAVKEKSEHLYLTIPEILDYHEFGHMRFITKKKSETFENIYLENYYKYLVEIEKPLETINLEDLTNQKIALINTDNNRVVRQFNLYKCLVFDTGLDKEDGSYHLNEGKWYKVNDDFLSNLKNYLDPLCKVSTLPSYEHANEGEYNASVPSANASYICLDKTNIAPNGETQMEPCDLFSSPNGQALFIHVKRSTKSASTSHLLNQGLNSAQVIRGVDESLQKLHQLLNDKGQPQSPLEKHERFSVAFAIVTHKNISKKSKNLPLFSKISLKRTLQSLERMNIDAWYEFIQDRST